VTSEELLQPVALLLWLTIWKFGGHSHVLVS